MTTIERIPLPSADAFRRDWLRPRRPVVLRGLLQGHALAALDTERAARERLGNAPVRIARNYMDLNVRNIGDFVAGRPVRLEPEVEDGTLAGYLDRVAAAPQERWIVTENVPAGGLLAGLALPALGVASVEPGYGDPAQRPDPTRAHSLLFVGGPGNASDLHTDWDGRQVVLYQVFGRKRAVLFPTGAAEALQPIDIFAMLRIRGLPDARRQALLQSLGGMEVVLEPGDALFMPAFFWHHLEYLEPAMSVSFRFDDPLDADLRFAIHNLHRDPVTQNLWTALLDEAVRTRHRRTLAGLRAACENNDRSGVDKYRAMRALCQAAYEQVCLDGAPYLPRTWVACADFLEPLLSYRYQRPPAAVAPAPAERA